MPRPHRVLKFTTTETGVVLERDAEFHEDKDDVFVIVKGEMHFILGGEPAGPIATKDNLTWTCPASKIVGGEEFVVGEGDEVGIPAGMWHSWTAPDSAIYAVAKVPAIEGRLRPVGV